MIDNVYNRKDYLVNNNNIKQNQELTGIDKKITRKNPYDNYKEFYDVQDISDKAKNLYFREKTVEQFKNLVSEMDQEEADLRVKQLLNSGKIEITNDDLASSMLEDDDLVNMLFQE